MTRCHKCGGRTVIHQRYSGMLLCRTHFEEDAHRKVRETLRRTGVFARGAHIAVGLSGDRKSATLLYVLKHLFFRRRDIEFCAIVIDEGIECRRGLLANALALAERLEVPCIVKSLREAAGIRAAESVLSGGTPSDCSACAAAKRGLLKVIALELGADALATGESLDDEAEKVLWGCLTGDIEGFLGIKQHEKRDPGLGLAELKPLRRVPEREIGLYARMHGLDPPDRGLCHQADASRLEVKMILNDFDSRHPGTKYSLLQSLERVVKLQQSCDCTAVANRRKEQSL